MKKIIGLQNPFIKNLIKLRKKSRERKKQGLFLIEGEREIFLASKGGYILKNILIVSEIYTKDIRILYTSDILIEITKEIYEKLAYRDSTEGIIAVAETRSLTLNQLAFRNLNPLILVMESIEKPGNIGAMLRTADAAKVDAVLIANPKTDLYNPNIIRSSIGCIFTNQIIVDSSENIVGFLLEKEINIYSAVLQNSNEYYKENYSKASAIVIGTEANGLTEIWREQATQNINIPMQGEIDSVNLSVAAAIIIFEAKRQRSFN